MDSPLLARPGAVPAQGTDSGVAAHYGDPYAGQRTLTRAAGQVDRSHRGIVRVTGPDRLSWLHSLTTQDLEHLQPGTSAQALVLSPQGHIEHHLTLADDYGFQTDVGHLTVFGRCESCRASAAAEGARAEGAPAGSARAAPTT